MFTQAYFNELVQNTLKNVNEIWEPLADKKLIDWPRVNIITRDGRTFHVRLNLGKVSNTNDVLHLVAYDAGTDESWLVCIPFDRIERVEVFDSKVGAAGKKISFASAALI